GCALPWSIRVLRMSKRIYGRHIEVLVTAGLPAALVSMALASVAVAAGGSAGVSPGNTIAAANAQSARPSTQTGRDVNRKPAEVLAFAGVKPGDKVGDYAAGQGYFTRLFSGIVGAGGHVYASVPTPLFQYPNIVKGISDINAYAKDHPNVTVTAA